MRDTSLYHSNTASSTLIKAPIQQFPSLKLLISLLFCFGILKDINECMDPNNTLCKKGAVCINTYGGYYCACPPGYHSHDSQPEHGCVRDKVKLKAAILVTSGIDSLPCPPFSFSSVCIYLCGLYIQE